MAEIPTFQEMPNIDTNGDGHASATEKATWAARKAPQLAAGVTVSVGGQPVRLSVLSNAMRFRPGQAGLPIIRMTATFAGRIAHTGRISISEHSYADRIGW